MFTHPTQEVLVEVWKGKADQPGLIPAGSPASTGGDTHRIDPQRVKDMATGAGFVFVSQSEVFANRDDDLTTNVFDESIRGKTDQFMLNFEKPE